MDEEMEINPENFKLIEIDGSPFANDENHIYLQHVLDGSIIIAPLDEEIKNMFFPCQATQQSTSMHKSSGTRTWTRSDILALIDAVKNHQEKFKSSTMKNDAVWKIISATLEKKGKCFTATQCKDKYKYLKGKYMKKKDNMSDRSSGAEFIKFEYFHEMDEFLGTSHNANPIALASNIKKHQVPDTEERKMLDSDDNDTDTSEPSLKKKKIATKRKLPEKESPLQKYVKELHENTNKREDNMERRHKENVESRKEALNVFAQKMDAIISIMANKNKQ
ncbi:unnamed protein product [Ceutorhynchus assimilis]|uniref:Myb/SANT-like DNA-binding domain-containing protein n=2 Tax=Ceutorhynchus assimilis TaxID=467358 RepID=A0A9N9MJ48_9CUCU|nr:unnamed protein product [Ceutorhynchus assimilis]